ncbi:MAG TPA: CRISPR-associated endonuclease Cas2 [Nitrospirae bacterium]|nr:CRISPR-associated endonuclease Cas2 [Nitrospirota bacterium]
MTCVVAYDIESNSIRAKLARFLENKGVRIQKSVFAVEIERHSFKRFLKQIENITGKDRKVAVFRLCIGCRKNAIQLADDKKFFYVF